MDKAKILRQCNEIERAANELYVKDSITRDERISLINLFGVIVEEITAQPKSNADRIRQMTDDELAEFLDIYDIEDICKTRCAVVNYQDCMAGEKCKGNILAWLKQEVSEDAETD